MASLKPRFTAGFPDLADPASRKIRLGFVRDGPDGTAQFFDHCLTLAVSGPVAGRGVNLPP